MISLQHLATEFSLEIPVILQDLQHVSLEPFDLPNTSDVIAPLFPHLTSQNPVRGHKGKVAHMRRLKVGVVFSGGQASGGHNVIAGLFDALKKMDKSSELIGFINGPDGIIKNKTKTITTELLKAYRNQGGFDLIGSGRTKIETDEQLEQSLSTVKAHELDGLVIIGGDDSNTNAAVLAEYFLAHGVSTKVVGVPKTIDGDLKNDHVPVSFGFDTAAKVYSELIGNIARDALSAKKYTHFIKLMGRSASHIALECALATQVNAVLISEEVSEKKLTLRQITNSLADIICERSDLNKNYGIILIPEGLIEFIPEIGSLISELNHFLAKETSPKLQEVRSKLSKESLVCFDSLPEKIQMQLFMDRDPHGNVQVSKIDTESLLIETVSNELKQRANAGKFKGKFSPVPHFFGYEGRAGFPSLFDAHYCYALGMTAALLLQSGATGMMAFVDGIDRPVMEWSIGGLPLTRLFNLEKRSGKLKPVIQKALVDLKGKPFLYLQAHRSQWAKGDEYRFPGPIQFFGPRELCFSIPISLRLEYHL